MHIGERIPWFSQTDPNWGIERWNQEGGNFSTFERAVKLVRGEIKGMREHSDWSSDKHFERKDGNSCVKYRGSTLSNRSFIYIHACNFTNEIRMSKQRMSIHPDTLFISGQALYTSLCMACPEKFIAKLINLY